MYRFVEEGNKIKVLERVVKGNYKFDTDIGTFKVCNIYLNGKIENDKKKVLGDKYFSGYRIMGTDLYVWD